jgi:hypothetical protein
MRLTRKKTQLILEALKSVYLPSAIEKIQNTLQNILRPGDPYESILAVRTDGIDHENPYVPSGSDLTFHIDLQHSKETFVKGYEDLKAKFTKEGNKTGLETLEMFSHSKTGIARGITRYKRGPVTDRMSYNERNVMIAIARAAGEQMLLTRLQPLAKEFNAEVFVTFIDMKTAKKGYSTFEILFVHHIPEDKVPSFVDDDDETSAIPHPEGSAGPYDPTKEFEEETERKEKHWLSPKELKTSVDEVVELLTGNTKSLKTMRDKHLQRMYRNCVDQARQAFSSVNSRQDQQKFMLRVSDDYFNNPSAWGTLKFSWGGTVSSKITSKSMMKNLLSVGSNLKLSAQDIDTLKGKTGTKRRAARNKLARLYNPDFGTNKEDEFTPPKLGGPEAKQARRYLSGKRATDEIIIYAEVTLKRNIFTDKLSQRSGKVMFYIFVIDRSE